MKLFAQTRQYSRPKINVLYVIRNMEVVADYGGIDRLVQLMW